MINYIIQTILFQALFIFIYDLFLSKETFFNGNRFYLLFTAIISFFLPLIKINSIQKIVSSNYTIVLPEVILSPQKVIEQSSWYQDINYLNIIFWLGLVLFLLVFIWKITKIIQLIIRNPIVKKHNYKLILLNSNTKAFSFFNYIFIGDTIPSEKRQNIIAHELVHSNQKHTLDLLFFETLKVIMWFNPMIYVYQHRVSLIHEFISDNIVSKSAEKKKYINTLLSDIFQVEHIAFINQFYKKSLLKKRIIMITKTQSKKVKQLKYLVLIPILSGMLLYTSCSNESKEIDTAVLLQNQTVYFDKGETSSEKLDKLSFMDVYIGKEAPKLKELTINDLTADEKNEYDNINNSVIEESTFILRVFEGFEGRKIIYLNLKENDSSKKNKTSQLLFSQIDQVPTFINKGETKTDFHKNMSQFVAANFNTELANSLGLDPGKKRIYLQFTINKEGEVTNIKARAPHPTLKEEAIRLAEKLPTFKPGFHEGKNVAVGYTLPISFEVK